MESSLLDKPWRYLFLAWLLSLLATSGSLFFSEVMQLPPCVLCWYQRIFMMPLVFVLGVGMWFRDEKVLRYGGPLLIAGMALAVYHNLLYYHWIPESISPCSEGSSCTTRQIDWFGFISIPLLSLGAFSAIIISLCFFKRTSV